MCIWCLNNKSQKGLQTLAFTRAEKLPNKATQKQQIQIEGGHDYTWQGKCSVAGRIMSVTFKVFTFEPEWIDCVLNHADCSHVSMPFGQRPVGWVHCSTKWRTHTIRNYLCLSKRMLKRDYDRLRILLHDSGRGLRKLGFSLNWLSQSTGNSMTGYLLFLEWED